MNVNRKIKVWALLASRMSWRHKGLWLRALLCWLVSFIFILADRDVDHDWRMQVRGTQPHSENIVLVEIHFEEWARWTRYFNPNLPPHQKEATYLTDGVFWDAKAWQSLLKIILNQNPRMIGVTPYFGNNLPEQDLSVLDQDVFKNKKVVWAAQVDDDGHILWPQFSKPSRKNTGLMEYMTDRDGIIRRYTGASTQLKTPQFAHQLTNQMLKTNDWLVEEDETRLINFRGPEGTFSRISLSDTLNGVYPSDYFRDKIVIIGLGSTGANTYRTPVGAMSRLELVAHVIDNIQNDRSIKSMPRSGIASLLLVFVLFVAVATSKYPQFLSLYLIFLVNIVYASLSMWAFDKFNLWIPIQAPLIASFVTYITFLSLQLTIKEYVNVQLENERRFLLDVEELKNNFLSLISHDLKTPIAKIQAICDRLLSQYPQHEFTTDLHSLRDVASELHRYIRTILQITRVEARDFRISKDATDMNEIIEFVVEQLEPIAKNKKIMLTTELEPMFLIEVDHVLIREVVMNLIENAIKYSPEGGHVKITSREVDDNVIIMVEDNGPGIPEDEQKKIFEKFYRGELGKSQTKGSGLGLYLVKYFVELHNGKILLDSNTKMGTRIGFSLPLSEQTELVMNEQPLTLPNGEHSHET